MTMNATQEHLELLRQGPKRTDEQQRDIDFAKDILRRSIPEPTDADALLWILGCSLHADDRWILRELKTLIRVAGGG